MFDNSIVNGAADGLSLLERIIDIIIRLFEALLGGGSSDTTAAEDTSAVAGE
ncbi:MAG: hypothetical protein IJZ35_07000 [Clostridia bacterium]|nr:hypothetical protein [Clostridia bacterium]